LRERLAFGSFTVTWTVERLGAGRSQEQLVDRVWFFDWLRTLRDAGFPFRPSKPDWPFVVLDDKGAAQRIASVRRWEEALRRWVEAIWPRHIFEDKALMQTDELIASWRMHSGQPSQDFARALNAVYDQLAVLSWEEKTRSIRRDDFVAWYKTSPLSRRRSSLTSLAVTANVLWPEQGESESFVGLSDWEAIKRACAAFYPNGVIPRGRGANVKGRNNAIRGYIKARDGKPPSTSQIYKVVKKLVEAQGQ
jgi:hypothetical protein